MRTPRLDPLTAPVESVVLLHCEMPEPAAPGSMLVHKEKRIAYWGSAGSVLPLVS